MMWRKDKDLTIIVVLNVAVSFVAWIVALVIDHRGGDTEAVARFLALPSGWDAFLDRPGTLVTYMVTQFSILHLIFNMLWLFWFGSIFLLSSTDSQLAKVYVSGGIAGGVAYIIATSAGVGAGSYLCGSSSAVLAVMCAAGVMQGNVRLRFMLLGNIKVKWVAAVCVLITLSGSRETPATTIAHLGGIAAGLIYGLILKYKSGDVSVKLNKEALFEKIRSRLPRKERERRPETVIEALRGRLSDHDRLDELLDKIRLSGYNSLTDTERRELEALSNRL